MGHLLEWEDVFLVFGRPAEGANEAGRVLEVALGVNQRHFELK